ncbi:DUF3096 domain-containing protein [Sulfobacillus harzensis]|uniref:DUF3096 domain-containing protein n=1 Tax=Sulfobacillus harzensis TaxID=2729629 RepID=A0A7Y0Q3R3_9FIRM|nr:DUF3096 domain-containing protein [Sulfobacillus harzensis]NMP24543.1 DUF3096 domain-containing protein [Sulfobacillus harzensis]
MRLDIVSLAAIIAGVVALWQPRHFRMAVGIYLLIVGVLGLGVIRV